MLAHSELLLRVATGAALGGAIGYERGRHRRPVGLRTHVIVALASATFMIVSSQFVYYQRFGAGDRVEVDASRIAASVVSAVGFLAGGAILRSGLSVQGLTTAAGLWLVTAIGLCAGAGMYVESSAVTLLGILALTVFRRFEDKNDLVTKRRIGVVLGDGDETESSTHAVMKAISDLGADVVDVEYERRLDEKPRTALTLDVSLPVSVTVAALVETLEALPNVKRIQISQPS
ncbi:MAG: MgtC/SapB family protein [Labilithrix sp.]|nr:MgtC/SapB family protein [Labilithrix sp.]MCW5837817.1 MgtC/SapB family protein [Labilithrix sp.]